MVDQRIVEGLNRFQPVSLEQMVSVRLMNRTDTKFLIASSLLGDMLEKMTESHYIQEINGNRLSQYHTVYLDTEEMAMYIAHQNGRKQRKKIRIRRYTDTDQSFFEIKDKDNKGRTSKSRVQLLTLNYTQDQQIHEFTRSKSDFSLSEIFPCVETDFKRITLVNKGMTERLTIDLFLSFYNCRTGLTQKVDDMVIIELKRDGNCQSPAKDLLARLHIRPISISKYCLGSILTDPDLKHNRFKSKLIQINKLTHRTNGSIRRIS